MQDILIKPLVTERSMQEAALGRFTFQVDLDANKKQIADQVAKLFNVHPVKVQTSIVKGKTKRAPRTRTYIKESPYKKAVVQLKPGEKVELFDIQEGQGAVK